MHANAAVRQRVTAFAVELACRIAQPSAKTLASGQPEVWRLWEHPAIADELVRQIPDAQLHRVWRRDKQSADLPADIEKFLPALLADGGGVHAAEVVEGLCDGVAGGGDHGGGIAMRAACRLLQYLIDHAEPIQVLRGDLQDRKSVV